MPRPRSAPQPARGDSLKALVKAKAEPGLWLQDVPEPKPGPGEVLIRVLRTGICGTDLHIDAWNEWAQATLKLPLVVGHEFVGEVVATGADVSDIAVGDLVSGEGHVVCGRCRNCMAGRRHLCAHSIGLGVQRPGAFAEYVALPMTNIWHHWPGIDEDVAAIFALHCFPQLPTGLVGVRSGPFTAAADKVEVRLRGPGGAFTSPVKESGSWTHKFTRGGTYKLVCTIHSGMKLTVKVR